MYGRRKTQKYVGGLSKTTRNRNRTKMEENERVGLLTNDRNKNGENVLEKNVNVRKEKE